MSQPQNNDAFRHQFLRLLFPSRGSYALNFFRRKGIFVNKERKADHGQILYVAGL
jgi:hypothetical protein